MWARGTSWVILICVGSSWIIYCLNHHSDCSRSWTWLIVVTFDFFSSVKITDLHTLVLQFCLWYDFQGLIGTNCTKTAIYNSLHCLICLFIFVISIFIWSLGVQHLFLSFGTFICFWNSITIARFLFFLLGLKSYHFHY